MRPWLTFCAVALVAGSTASVAVAQRLGDLVAAARAHDPDVAVARAEAAQREAEVALARASLYPALTLVGGYTRNQSDATATLPGAGGGAPTTITFIPLDQLEAAATVTVPLLDLGARRQVAAAAAAHDAARLGGDAAVREAERAVVRAYHGWVGGAALVSATAVAEAAAVANLEVVEQRAAAQLASRLDVTRAAAAVADTRRSRAAAELVVATARRQLATLTGVEVGADAPALADDDAPEDDLATWLGAAGRQPDVRAAEADVGAARARVAAARAGWWPTIGLTATERWTNAAGFGDARTGSIGVSATWRLELGTGRRTAVERAAVVTASARAARAAQVARDRVIDAWNTVAAQRAAVAAAQARTSAAEEGAAVAATRFAAGTATQLEVVEAQREAFAAAVALVQARAELGAARGLLRLAAGREVEP